jgi:hypothetical protein
MSTTPGSVPNAEEPQPWSNKEILELCLELCGFKAKDNLARISLSTNEILSARDWVGLDDPQIDNLVAVVKKSNITQKHDVSLGSKNRIRFMRNFLQDLHRQQHNRVVWSDVTKEEFDDYCFTGKTAFAEDQSSIDVGPPSRPSFNDPASQFSKATKRDKANYKPLKEDRMWDQYYMGVNIQAHADGIERQLDATYVPQTPQDIARDELESKYFFSVLHETLQTSKGKTIVRRHMKTLNARAAFADLVQAMTKSTKAKHSKSDLLQFIVNARFGHDSVSSAEQFYLLFLDKLRVLDTLTPTEEQIPPSVRMVMLQSAVHSVSELRQVKTNAETLAVKDNKEITYEDYCTLLESAAVEYDQAHKKAPKTRQNMNHHEFDADDPYQDEVFDQAFQSDYATEELIGDIDIAPEQYFSVSKTFQKPGQNCNFQKQNQNFGQSRPSNGSNRFGNKGQQNL